MPRLLSSCFLVLSLVVHQGLGFTAVTWWPKSAALKTTLQATTSLPLRHFATTQTTTLTLTPAFKKQKKIQSSSSSFALYATPPDLDVVALVAGQENYGLAIVVVGEGIYSFLQAPTMDNIIVLIPPIIAAVILVAVSGPMITSVATAATVATGLWIATAVSLALGAFYVFRLLDGSAATATAPKEIAFLGLLVAVAGFFSFSQNLIVDGFVALPSIDLPSLPSMPSLPPFNFQI